MAAAGYLLEGELPGAALRRLNIDLLAQCRAREFISLGPLGDFSGLETLGSGSYGIVYRAKRRPDPGKPDPPPDVAIKHTSTESFDMTGAPLEHEILDGLNHPNVLTQTGWYDDKKGNLFMLSHFASDGSLHDVMSNCGGRLATPKDFAPVAKQLALALEYINAKGIVHRDIKPRNVLLDGGKLKLADFGLAVRAGFECKPCGTTNYMPLEHRHDRLVPADPTLDIWAYGATLFECAVGTPPIYVDGSPWPPWPASRSNIGEEFVGLVNTCLALDPRERTNIERILALPFMRGLADDVAGSIRSSKWCGLTADYKAICEDRDMRPHTVGCPMMPPSSCSCQSIETDRARGKNTQKPYLVPLWAQRGTDRSTTVEVAKIIVGISEEATAADSSLVDRAWGLFKEGTEAGSLGFAAKLSRRDAAQPAVLVYIEDVRDEENKARVVSTVHSIAEQAGFVPLTGDGKPLSADCFKTDRQTKQGLYSSFADGLGLRKS